MSGEHEKDVGAGAQMPANPTNSTPLMTNKSNSLWPKTDVPDLKSTVLQHASGSLSATLREASSVGALTAEHERLKRQLGLAHGSAVSQALEEAKRLDLLYGTAASQALDEFKRLDLLQGSATAQALGQFNNSAVATAAGTLRQIELPAISTASEVMRSYQERFEMQLGPIQELLKNVQAVDHVASLRDGFAKQYADSYVLNDAARQFARLEHGAAASIATAASIKLSTPEFSAFSTLRESLGLERDIASVIKSFQTPWAKLDDLLGSAVGLVEVSTLFAAVRHKNPFADQITEYLRFELGDYRDARSWDEDQVVDPIARLDLYTDEGLREELKDTPGEVLVEAEAQVEIHQPSAVILTPFSFRALFASDGQETHMMAHNALRVLERRLRTVIDAEMTRVFGQKWVQSTLKKEIRDDWIGKQEQAVRQGRPKDALIEYADFTHYEQIITANAPWEQVFKPFFRRKEDVRESFQRLGPVRIATYHARQLLDMDILVLTSEAMRLMQALALSPA
jgi:hypothetical protein